MMLHLQSDSDDTTLYLLDPAGDAQQCFITCNYSPGASLQVQPDFEYFKMVMRFGEISWDAIWLHHDADGLVLFEAYIFPHKKLR